jgi:hypothetical protein
MQRRSSSSSRRGDGEIGTNWNRVGRVADDDDDDDRAAEAVRPPTDWCRVYEARRAKAQPSVLGTCTSRHLVDRHANVETLADG